MVKIILLFALCGIVSCQEQEPTVDHVFNGEHKLRRFKVTNENGYSWSAGFFLVAGAGSGSTFDKTEATFSWLMNTGEYAISKMPIVDIRVQINDSINDPYIIFNYEPYRIGGKKSIKRLIEICVNYITVYCSENDYPIELKIDDLVK